MKKLWQQMLFAYVMYFLAALFVWFFGMSGLMAGVIIMGIVAFAIGIFGFVTGIWLWVYGAKYENLIELVKKGEEAEALDKLYESAKLESNNTIIDSDELEDICKKAKIKLNFE